MSLRTDPVAAGIDYLGMTSSLGNQDLYQERSAFAGSGKRCEPGPEKQKAGAPPREPRPAYYVLPTADYQPDWTSVTFPYQSLVT